MRFIIDIEKTKEGFSARLRYNGNSRGLFVKKALSAVTAAESVLHTALARVEEESREFDKQKILQAWIRYRNAATALQNRRQENNEEYNTYARDLADRDSDDESVTAFISKQIELIKLAEMSARNPRLLIEEYQAYIEFLAVVKEVRGLSAEVKYYSGGKAGPFSLKVISPVGTETFDLLSISPTN